MAAPSWRPSRLALLLEGRALLELGSLAWQWPLLAHAPRGDGHAVLVLPGLLASDTSTGPLRRHLARQGWSPHGWAGGRNLGPRAGVIEALHERLRALHERSGRKVSLVGWSLGGLYARELARQNPDAVRQVITLGTPLYGHPEHTTRSWRTYKAVSRGKPIEPAALNREAPPVPTTSIFSRSDGIVGWRASVEKAGPGIQNIETLASHLGLGVNALVLWAVADRLAQPEDAWRPFDPPALLRPFYRFHAG